MLLQKHPEPVSGVQLLATILFVNGSNCYQSTPISSLFKQLRYKRQNSSLSRWSLFDTEDGKVIHKSELHQGT